MVTAQYKQLSDFMLITEPKFLEKIASQIFMRYPTDESLKKCEIDKQNDYYSIPFIQIKQELERIQHESLMVTDMILDWEKGVVEKIGKEEKDKLIADKEKVGLLCHIHYASEKYIKANRKPEGYAKSTNRYKTLKGALHCLVTDCHISGIQTESDDTQMNLFENEH